VATAKGHQCRLFALGKLPKSDFSGMTYARALALVGDPKAGAYELLFPINETVSDLMLVENFH
jgi:hypothetical protein